MVLLFDFHNNYEIQSIKLYFTDKEKQKVTWKYFEFF